jgi:N-acetylneuraminic acid mutarotase
MRNFLLVSVALSLAVLAAFPSAVSAQVCNPYTQGAWSVKAPIPTPIVRAWGVYFPANDRFYTMGGRQTDVAGSDYLNPREYNPTANTWVVKAAAFPNNQVNNMVGGILNIGGTDMIVVVGGSAAGATTATSDVRTYNPVTDTLTVVATDPWPGNIGGTVLPGGGAVFNNSLYVFGGFNIGVGMTSQIWQLNPASAPGTRWTLKAAALPAPRGYIPTARSGNFIYMAGGSDFVGGTLVDSNQSLRYDPVADVITTIAPIPRATAETRAVLQVFDNTVWVLGGGRTPPNPVTQIDVYNPATNTWSIAPPMLTARRNFPADIVLNAPPVQGARVWAVGGYDTGGVTPLAVNEQFTCTVPVDLMSFGVE